ncbi:MAG: Hsp20/alpha crystallin family protein [Dehalococcoidia bacterium]
MPNIQRWEPFRDLVSLREAMDGLFDKSFVPFRGFAFGENGETNYFPVDVTETSEEITVRAQMPGVRPEEVEISVHGNVLTIKSQAHSETLEEGKTWHRREIRSGAFARNFTLPADVNADSANANFEHGVLTLTLPKSEEAKPKRIEVRSVETSATPAISATV